jgi:hypothetical protein
MSSGVLNIKELAQRLLKQLHPARHLLGLRLTISNPDTGLHQEAAYRRHRETHAEVSLGIKVRLRAIFLEMRGEEPTGCG